MRSAPASATATGSCRKASVSRPGREPETFDTYTVSTYLTRERVGEALGSEIAVSLWQLPSLIEVAEKAGLSAARYKMQYALLMSRPMLLDGHGYFGRHCVPAVIPVGGHPDYGHHGDGRGNRILPAD